MTSIDDIDLYEIYGWEDDNADEPDESAIDYLRQVLKIETDLYLAQSNVNDLTHMLSEFTKRSLNQCNSMDELRTVAVRLYKIEAIRPEIESHLLMRGFVGFPEIRAFLDTSTEHSVASASAKEAYLKRLTDYRNMPYDVYLKTDHWRELRNLVAASAQDRCQLCNRPGHHVHHRTYARLGHERMDDLILLCSDCHKLFHENRTVNNHE